MNLGILEDKYIDLILKRCLNFDKSSSLFINYIKENKNVVDKIIEKAKKIGIEDIYLDEEDLKKTHELLINLSVEEIKKDEYFRCDKWDEYAKKDASFLILESYIPKLMDDIDEEKISASNYVKRTTKPIYKKKQMTYDIPWCICCLPNELWAKELFPDKENSYELLYKTLLNICMVDEYDPIDNWNNYIKDTIHRVNKLNELKIKKLHYKNDLGTDLIIELIPDSVWEGVGTGKEENMLVNMPSYEIFTSPNSKKTEGIVYSSKPLNYNGALIDEFWLKFEKGKVIDFDAKKGKKILEGIINSDDGSSYLGEAALVSYDSPISNTNLVFYETLLDENASCHLALGEGFKTVIKDYDKYSDEEIEKMGLNISKVHVDFMIGTKDLNIVAETDNGNIEIFKDGNFVI